jgi:hypothetical protein
MLILLSFGKSMGSALNANICKLPFILFRFATFLALAFNADMQVGFILFGFAQPTACDFNADSENGAREEGG